MTVLTKVLRGSIDARLYEIRGEIDVDTLRFPTMEYSVRLANDTVPLVIRADDHRANLHSLTATSDYAVIFDVIGPPYHLDTRPCTYFKPLPTKEQSKIINADKQRRSTGGSNHNNNNNKSKSRRSKPVKRFSGGRGSGNGSNQGGNGMLPIVKKALENQVTNKKSTAPEGKMDDVSSSNDSINSDSGIPGDGQKDAASPFSLSPSPSHESLSAIGDESLTDNSKSSNSNMIIEDKKKIPLTRESFGLKLSTLPTEELTSTGKSFIARFGGDSVTYTPCLLQLCEDESNLELEQIVKEYTGPYIHD